MLSLLLGCAPAVTRDPVELVPGTQPDPGGVGGTGGGDSAPDSALGDTADAIRKYFEKGGFFEKEVARRVEQFGNIAHVWSTYESRHTNDAPEPYIRGINSIQLFNDGARWWVMNVYWQAETPTGPLPADYLPPAG